VSITAEETGGGIDPTTRNLQNMGNKEEIKALLSDTKVNYSPFQEPWIQLECLQERHQTPHKDRHQEESVNLDEPMHVQLHQGTQEVLQNRASVNTWILMKQNIITV
jgi:hypothetical protein